MSKKAKWVKIEDAKLRHVWTCGTKGCKGEAIVAPGWYADNGTPVCQKCDEDLCYDHTEIMGGGNPVNGKLLAALKALLPMAESAHEVPPTRARRAKAAIDEAEGN